MTSFSQTQPSLAAIIALARAGASVRARRLFRAAGLEAVDDDAAVLSVRGRLLKDEAQSATGAERSRLWRAAGNAYARASELGGATYPLINAATLALLGGDGKRARARARWVLEKLDRGETGPETPYYLAATRAEALLLLGKTEDARAAVAEAVRRAPEAWEDHASTFRQLSLVLTAMGQDDAWLQPLRPPGALHFAGGMGLAPSAATGAEVRAALAEARVGFAYGALAAGADILAAEAALEAGAELHLVLPAAPDRFRDRSVAGFGGDWGERFDAVIDRAESLRVVGPATGDATVLDVLLAAQAAMGAATLRAASLSSDAVQLLVVGEDAARAPGDGVTARIGADWRLSGRRQWRVRAGAATGEGGSRLAEPDPRDLLATVLAVELGEDPETAMGAVREGLATQATLVPPALSGDTAMLAFGDPLAAAAMVRALSETLAGAGRIAGHYAVARREADPLGGGAALVGPAAGLPLRMLGSVPDGAAHLSETLAAALHASTPPGRLRTQQVGELATAGEPVGLYSLEFESPV